MAIEELEDFSTMSYEDQVARFPEPGLGGNFGTPKKKKEGETGKVRTMDEWRQWSDEKEAEASKVRMGQLHSSLVPATASPATALKKQLTEAYALEDPLERSSAFFQAVASRDNLIAKAQLSALNQAEQEFHVPELQKMYNRALELDKADPLWQKYQAPSTATNKLQDQIIQASNAAQGQAKKYYLANADVQGLSSIESEFKRFEQVNASLERGSAQRAEKEKALMLFGEESRWLAKAITPGLKPEALDATTIEYMKHDQFRQVVLTTNPTELLPMAIKGNRIAESALIERQAMAASGGRQEGEVYNQAKVKAVQGYQDVWNFANNPAFRAQTLAALYPAQDGKTNPELAKLLVGIDLEGKGPEAAAGRLQGFIDIGNKILAQENQKKFEGDVRDWNTSSMFKDPATPLGKLMTISKDSLGENSPIGLATLASNIRKLDPAIRANAQASLLEAANESVKTYSGRYLGNFTDSMNLDLTVQKYMAEGIHTWGAAIGHITSTVAKGAIGGAGFGAAVGLLPGAIAPVTVPVGAVIGGVTGGAVSLAKSLNEIFSQ